MNEPETRIPVWSSIRERCKNKYNVMMIMKIIFKTDFELIVCNFEYKLFVFIYNDQKDLIKIIICRF